MKRNQVISFSFPLWILWGVLWTLTGNVGLTIGEESESILSEGTPLKENEPVAIGTDRELMLDNYVIDRMENVTRKIGVGVDRGKVLEFTDFPWEGSFCTYVTVIYDGEKYRLYYRGFIGNIPNQPLMSGWGCYAESEDGIVWTKPKLGIVPFPTEDGSTTTENNIILTNEGQRFTADNFAPFLDTRPGVPPTERFKGAGGNYALRFLYSADGIHWQHYAEEEPFNPPGYLFDSQNVSFWSESEKKYLLYMRSIDEVGRTIARSESDDYIHWSDPVLMEYKTPEGAPARRFQYYISQTRPYFRAPQIIIATPARFMENRSAVSSEEAKKLSFNEWDDPDYWRSDCADIGLLVTRGGHTYVQPFDEALIRPGIGKNNWTSRTNYPASGIVPTGEDEMSIYVISDYAQKTIHLKRYAFRLDGLASINAKADGGVLVTKPLTFEGNRLELNYSTSAAGSLIVEIQDEEGNPIPGFTRKDFRELIGNEIAGTGSWGEDAHLDSLHGKPVRLAFYLTDADLYSFRFAP